MSLKDKIIEAGKRATGRLIPVKVWGEDAFIRVMTGTERDAFEAHIYDNGKLVKEQFRAKLLVKAIADENGIRQFQDSDTGILSEMDSVELTRLYEIAARANGLTKDDVEELTKNS